MTSPLAGGRFGLLPVTDVAPAMLQAFACGRAGLDSFLQNQAISYHQARLGYAWVVVHQDFDSLVGYFTLNNDALELSTSEEGELGLQDHAGLKRFPAVNVGRLAVNQALHKTGVSKQVLHLALDQILGNEATPSAARLVVVDAANDDAVLRFYRRHGFESSAWADKQASNQGGKKPRNTIKMLRDILTPWAPA